MKKTAFLLLFIFALVQAGPAVSAIFNPVSIVFLVDEEKNDHKTDQEKKEKKDYSSFTNAGMGLQTMIQSRQPMAESILNPPFLEKPTPPPNFL